MAWSSKVSALPPASLKLLVPPVRLMAAFMWKVAQQDSSVMHYDKLLDFISLATEMVPELLSPSQKVQLMLGLRAKLILELCRGDGVANLNTIQAHLDKIHSCCIELSTCDQMETDILKTSYSSFATLVQDILNIPSEKEVFFKTFFPKHYGPVYNKRIQQLASLFLSRLEELMPTPNLHQTTVWLSETSASEEFKHHLSEPLALRTLLVHHRELGTLSSVCPSNEDDIILSALSFTKPVNEFSEADDEEDSNEGSLALDDLDEDSSQCITDTDDSEDWFSKKKSDLFPRFSISSKGPGTPPVPTKVRECVQKAVQRKKSEKKGRSKTLQKSLKMKSRSQKLNINNPRRGKQKGRGEEMEKEKKEDNSKKKRCRKRKEPTGEDKRFLSTRTVKKNFPEEDTKCPTCEKVFEHPNQMKTHLKLHTFRYSCIECDKGFMSRSGYDYHQKIHKKGRIFKCNQCSKAFPSRYALKQHNLLHDGPSNFCQICKKNFSKNGYIRHVLMHKGERNYLCTTCGKAFLSSGELQLHNRTHTGELPYTCVHCGKGFSCKAHLIVHTRSHTGDRPYLCTECPKRFLTLNCLKRHTLSHNGVKPFKCSECDKEFSQKSLT
ncbi:zinc finger protein 878 isoform X2 [Austrofundulus limnaeus]|uniref:Zinc finger protein 878 isoform X2 n=1 Tax=Austrofundulus limnaeus TaxID=52670 RepID=A0A2I4AXP2_AUSLI|nr:PREDICTED: zinc finger protein 878-like isoform X2 [Austrofundulus limnaeus]